MELKREKERALRSGIKVPFDLQFFHLGCYHSRVRSWASRVHNVQIRYWRMWSKRSDLEKGRRRSWDRILVSTESLESSSFPFFRSECSILLCTPLAIEAWDFCFHVSLWSCSLSRFSRSTFSYELQVKEGHRSSSIGSTLMKMLELLASKTGMRKCMLTVFNSNLRGIEFYQKLG